VIRYKVIVSEEATVKIVEHAEYIAALSGSWNVAETWVQRVYDALASLDYMPDRYAIAEESRRLDGKLHRILIGKYIANYSIDQADKVVRVISFRHGAQRI
jgi:plasmid stabilization system protein ParE